MRPCLKKENVAGHLSSPSSIWYICLPPQSKQNSYLSEKRYRVPSIRPEPEPYMRILPKVRGKCILWKLYAWVSKILHQSKLNFRLQFPRVKIPSYRSTLMQKPLNQLHTLGRTCSFHDHNTMVKSPTGQREKVLSTLQCTPFQRQTYKVPLLYWEPDKWDF